MNLQPLEGMSVRDIILVIWIWLLVAGNFARAYKHHGIGAKAGDEECLKLVEVGFEHGFVTKDEYAGALRGFIENSRRLQGLQQRTKPYMYKIELAIY